MRRTFLLTSGLLLLSAVGAAAQSQPSKQQPSNPPSSSSNGTSTDDILNAPMTPPRSDTPPEKPAADKSNKSSTDEFPFPESEENPGSYSSSKDSRGDISPPANDASHPGADVKVDPNDDVVEMKPWNPNEADKDVEVGTFYFRRGNYKAAEARFRDALKWMDNHAEANYRLATVLEKEGKHTEARQYYEAYLKILPKGEFAGDSRKALSRLNDANEDTRKNRSKKNATSPPS